MDFSSTQPFSHRIIFSTDILNSGYYSKFEEESSHNLVDLYFNMTRAFERGNYVDVLARFWRLREGILYYRLSKYGINKRNLDKSRPESLKTLQEKDDSDAVDWVKNRFKENLSGLSRVLSNVFGDTEIKAFEKTFKNELESLRLTRKIGRAHV